MTSMRTIQLAPSRLVDDQGKIHFGTFAGPIADTNLIDAKPWSLNVPRPLRAMRLKEWQAFQFGDSRWFFAVALFNAKLIALVQVKVYDRANKRKYVYERKLPGWALDAPRNMLHSQMQYGELMLFFNRLDNDNFEIDLDIPAGPTMPRLRGSVSIYAEACEPQVVCIPFAENRGMYSHKACMQLDGLIDLGADTIELERADSFALMDDHKGYYPYVMRWDWVTGGGVDARGRRIGFNLTRNDSIDPARYNENCVWIDGRLHLLPPVRFTRRPELSPEIWEVRDEAGEVAVDFVIELDGHVKVNALIVESRYRGPFGIVRGFVLGPGGERVELDGLFGMGEDFHLRC
ncbi:DUF2804 domain-containing protein [Nannocystaceae bacterium ST9]